MCTKDEMNDSTVGICINCGNNDCWIVLGDCLICESEIKTYGYYLNNFSTTERSRLHNLLDLFNCAFCLMAFSRVISRNCDDDEDDEMLKKKIQVLKIIQGKDVDLDCLDRINIIIRVWEKRFPEKEKLNLGPFPIKPEPRSDEEFSDDEDENNNTVNHFR